MSTVQEAAFPGSQVLCPLLSRAGLAFAHPGAAGASRRQSRVCLRGVLSLAGTVRLIPTQTTTLPKEKSLQHTAAAATGKSCLPGWKTQAGLENQQHLHPLTQLHSVVLQPLTQLPLFSHGKRLNQGGSTAVSSKRWMCAKPCRNPTLKATGQAQPPSQPAIGAFGSPILPCGLGFVPDGTFLWSLD